jgi:hypothetical protein
MFGPNANISSSKQHYSLKILNEAENVVSALKGSISEICSERQNTLIEQCRVRVQVVRFFNDFLIFSEKKIL